MWVKGFLKRHRLSLRTRTRQGQSAPDDAKEVADNFARRVRTICTREGIQEIINADQTAIFFELLPKKTICDTGSRTVWVRSTGKEKEKVSVMLAGSNIGHKFDPFFVLKTAPSKNEAMQRANHRERNGFGVRVWRSIEALQVEHGVSIWGNAKGWFNEELVIEWMQHTFQFYKPGVKKLLLLDDFSAHKTQRVRETAARLNLVLDWIPAGYTSVSQPADISWIKPSTDM